MKKIFLYIILVSLFTSCSSVNFYERGKTHLNILASDDFHGRGYVHDGLQKAENYIVKELKSYKLKSPYKNFKQEFDFPINIIKDAHLSQNNKELKFGIDYLVSPSSPSISLQNKNIVKINIQNPQHFEDDEIPYFNWSEFPDSLSNRDKSHWINAFKTQYNPIAVMIGKDKMTHSLSQKQSKIPSIFVIPEKIDFTSKINLSVESTFNFNFYANNLIAKAEGKKSDSAIILTAHYDHLGQVGNTIFNGANDNASGTSLLLNLAEYYSKNKPEYDTYFCFFAGEEAGLIGSKYSTENFPIALEKIKFLVNLDIMGTGVEGIAIVFGQAMPAYSKIMVDINEKNNYIAKVEPRGEACNSDHCYFYRKGVKTFFLYTMGGVIYYHDPLDRPETLPLTAFDGLGKLIPEFLEAI